METDDPSGTLPRQIARPQTGAGSGTISSSPEAKAKCRTGRTGSQKKLAA